MSKVKIVCKVEWEGDLYEGVTVVDGVNMSIGDACVEGFKTVQFDNGDKSVVLMYDHIQSVTIGDDAPNNFLLISPVV